MNKYIVKIDWICLQELTRPIFTVLLSTDWSEFVRAKAFYLALDFLIFLAFGPLQKPNNIIFGIRLDFIL
jgi:hypothetical protein